MRILVTGAGGMLGSSLVPALLEAGHDVHPTDLKVDDPHPWGHPGPRLRALDVRCRPQIQAGFEQVDPEFMVHLAAMTSLEDCEADWRGAYDTNALGTKHVALACQAAGIPIVYISTAGVFDGEQDRPYHEFDQPNPINVYGASKLAGERYVQTFLDRFYVVRAGWMVGGGYRDHKFVGKILGQLESGATVIHAVGDKLGTPTYAPDFSRCLTTLMSTGSYGLYHMACHGRASRFDVARRILDALGRDDVRLVEVPSSFFQEAYPAPRPPSEMMTNLLLDLQGWNTMRPWEDAITEYLRSDFVAPAAARLEEVG